MEFHIVIPVLISFAISAVLGPVIIPFLRKLKMGQTERTEPSEESRNPDYGRRDFSDIHDYYFIILCERLPEDHSGAVPDIRLRTDRISG